MVRLPPMRIAIPVVLLLALVVGGVAGALVLKRRADGVRALEEVLARHEAMGIGSRGEDIRQYCPPVNTGVQERLFAWMKLPARQPVACEASEEDIDRWARGLTPAPLGALKKDIEHGEPMMREFLGLLEDPLLCMTSLGFARQDLPRRDAGLMDTYSVRIPNLLACRWVAQHFGRRALISGNPDLEFGVLDRFHELLKPSGNLIDALIGVACDSLRDQTYLRAALLGRLPSPREEAWLGEADCHLNRLANGLRGERLLACALARDLLSGAFPPDDDQMVWWDDDSRTPLDTAQWSMRVWLTGPRDFAVVLDYIADFEAALRTERHTEDLPERLAQMAESLGPIPMSIVPNLPSGLRSCLEAGALGRAARLVSLLLRFRAEFQGLPGTEVEFRGWLGERSKLLLPGPLRLGLRYECTESGVIKITMDPGHIVDPLVAQALDRSESYSYPPRKDALYDWDELGITIDFSKIPVRR